MEVYQEWYYIQTYQYFLSWVSLCTFGGTYLTHRGQFLLVYEWKLVVDIFFFFFLISLISYQRKITSALAAVYFHFLQNFQGSNLLGVQKVFLLFFLGKFYSQLTQKQREWVHIELYMFTVCVNLCTIILYQKKGHGDVGGSNKVWLGSFGGGGLNKGAQLLVEGVQVECEPGKEGQVGELKDPGKNWKDSN